MENLIKDEAIVLNRNFIGEKDLSITIYMKSKGRESIVIQNGQILRNLPYSVLSPFTWFKSIFLYYKDKVYILEIDKLKHFGLDLTDSYSRFETAFKILDLIYKYAPHNDPHIYTLLKKSLFYLTKTEHPNLVYLTFLVRLIYLNGEFSIEHLHLNEFEKNIVKSLIKKSLKEIVSQEKTYDLNVLNKLTYIFYQNIQKSN